MSFKIFTLQLTGKIGNAEKIEAARKKLEQTYHAFLEAECSAELERFRELEKWVASGIPDQRKRELQAEVFKGSLEYNQLREYENLKKNKSFTDYFKVEGSPELTRFLRVDGSDKLKNYWEMKDYAEGEYLQEQREILSQRYAGSAEERLVKELAQLKKNKSIAAYFRLKDSLALKKHLEFANSDKLKRFLELKNVPKTAKEARKAFALMKQDPEIRQFFRMEKSQDLKRYRKMEGRHVLERYEELIRETGKDAFRQRIAWLKDPKKLEKSDSWKKFLRFKELEKSSDIVFYKKFKKSPLYRNYLDVKDSFDLARYNELKKLIASPEFLKRKAWLEDVHKWEKSEEYAGLEELERLRKHPKVVLYNKYKDAADFDFLKNWEVSFRDTFEGSEVSPRLWTFNTLWAERLLQDRYSQQGDLQGYTGGKNCMVRHGKLVVQVKKEKTAGKQWQPTVGFVPVDFGYSSDLLSTINSFWQKEGIFEAKIKFSPFREVVSSCHLLGEEPSPQITLLEMGPECRMGVLSMVDSGKPVFKGIGIKNLKPGKFYLFRVEWEGSRFTWKINDQVVFETHLTKPDAALHLNLASLVVSEIAASRLPMGFETDWISCYRRKTV